MPNYIMELRKWIGHQPVLMVGASVIVEDGRGGYSCSSGQTIIGWGYAGRGVWS